MSKSSNNEVEALSKCWKRDNAVAINNIKNYSQLVISLMDVGGLSSEDRGFVNDTLDTFVRIITGLEKDKIELQKENDEMREQLLERQEEQLEAGAESQVANLTIAEDEPSPTGSARLSGINEAMISSHQPRTTIKLNELVIKPAMFDGSKPLPRKWIEEYKDAIDANGWSDFIAVKYFQTFLSGTAYTWYKTEVKPMIVPHTRFTIIEEAFRRNYLNASDYARLSKQAEEASQRQNEMIGDFIPRMREILLLLEPKMSDREQMRQISLKLRPEYRQWIAFQEPETVSELKRCCQKVEAGLVTKQQDARPTTNSQPGNRPHSKKSGAQPAKNSGSKQETKRKCYRCNRNTHIAKDCIAKTKADGTKLPPKNQATVNNVGDGIKHVCSEVVTVRSQVNHIRCHSKLIGQTITCNGQVLDGLVDTGAWSTIIKQDIAKQYGWKIEPTSERLSGPDGEGLTCIGASTVKLELTLGSYTKKVTYKATVVKNLAEDLILGLELLATLDVNISTKGRKLSFSQESLRTGVRLAEAITLPPRSINVVPTTVNTIGSVLLIPIQLEAPVLIANSISEVTANEAQAMILNPTNQEIGLKEGLQIALYEEQRERNETTSHINMLQSLGSTNDVTNIGDNLDPKQVKELNQLLSRNLDAFSIGGKIGKTDLVEHKIELVEGAKPFAEPLRRRPLAHIQETRRQVRQMLEEGIIEESDSAWASAYVLAKKKNGDLRLCVDFRRLNMVTKKTVYPLPNTEDCLETLAGKHYFSTIDFASGFWQIPVEESSKELTAFRTEDGQFQFCRMPFGLTNAPASFQRMINALLTGLKGINLQVFIDDVCIATTTWKEHLELLQKLFSVVSKSRLKIKGNKCIFGARRVTFLGHEISSEGIKQEPSKLKAIREMPPPTDATGVKRVLGLLSYYRKFVPKFALIAEPLTRLTRKGITFEWTGKEESAYRELIKQLSVNAALKHFDHRHKTIVKTDASRQGVAGMILQDGGQGLQIVSCCSRRISDCEANYGVTELEGLAVVYTLSKFRHYLLGKHFELIVDHCPLCVLKDKVATSPRIRRWSIILSEFDFNVVHSKGNLHEDIDCLSRAPVDDPIDPYLDDKVFNILSPLDPDDWRSAYDDAESKEIVEKAKAGLDKFRLLNDIVYLGDQLYIPLPMRQEAIAENHSAPVAGHGGVEATVKRLSALVWWPNLRSDVSNFIERCDICQRRKAEKAKQAGTMHSFDVLEPNALIAIDCLGPITQTIRGNRHVIVGIDSFTRFVDAMAVDDTTAANFAEFLAQWCGRYGIPKAILTDNAKTFRNKMITDMTTVFGIEHKSSAPEHSRGNAIVERAIQSLQEKLNLVMRSISAAEHNWDFSLPAAVLSINTSYNKTTGYSPFELVFGRQQVVAPAKTAVKDTTTYDMHAQLLALQLATSHEQAVENQAVAQGVSRKYFERTHRPRSFEIGDLVLIRKRKRRGKLEDRYQGPYTVISRNQDIYTVRADKSKQLMVRHVSCLKPYLMTKSALQENAPEVQLEDEEDIPSPPFEPITPPQEAAITSTNADDSPPQLEDKEGSNGLSELPGLDDGEPITPPVLTKRRAASKRPRKRKSPAVQVSPIMNIMALLFLAVSTAWGEGTFSNVIWRQTRYGVDRGQALYSFEMQFSSPCGVLWQYATSQQDTLKRALQICEGEYNSSIVKVTDSFNLVLTDDSLPRKKRFIAEFILGAFVSNTVRTLIDRIFNEPTTTEMKRTLMDTSASLRELQTSTNLSHIAVTSMTEMMAKVSQDMDTLRDKVDFLENQMLVLTTTTNFIASKIAVKSGQLKKLRHALMHGQVDYDAMSDLCEHFWPMDTEEFSARPVRAISKSAGHLRLDFWATRRAKDTQIYIVDPFPALQEINGTMVGMIYQGPNYIVVNSSNACVEGISPPIGDKTIMISCLEADHVDTRLQAWRRMSKEEEETIGSQTHVKLVNGHYAVLCFPHEITIEGKTKQCANHYETISIDRQWNTTDYKPDQQSLMTRINLLPATLPLATSIHGANGSTQVDHGQNIKRLLALEARLKASSAQKALKADEIQIDKIWSLIVNELSVNAACLAIGLIIGATIALCRRTHFRKVQSTVDATVREHSPRPLCKQSCLGKQTSCTPSIRSVRFSNGPDDEDRPMTTFKLSSLE